MRVLDLFCGAGGASWGYSDAGYLVTGVDLHHQPHYPFDFVLGDVLELEVSFLREFDLIHASPPCQRFSQANRGLGNHLNYPDLIAPTRNMLQSAGRPYVIENVLGAPLHFPIMLCGSMFGLENQSHWLRRHRYFECSHMILAPGCKHPKNKISMGVYGNGTNSWHRTKLGRNITTQEQRELMGINWMTRKSLVQSIPPAYTRFIGRQFAKVAFSGSAGSGRPNS